MPAWIYIFVLIGSIPVVVIGSLMLGKLLLGIIFPGAFGKRPKSDMAYHVMHTSMDLNDREQTSKTYIVPKDPQQYAKYFVPRDRK